MSEAQADLTEEKIILPQKPIINDFCIAFSTVNGSGSITANLTLLKAFFRMGIPVCGKNILPSNIQGLPTWYTIRVNQDGFLGRKETDDIVVAMNPATVLKEFEYLVPGGVLLYADDIKFTPPREDIIIYPMPVKKIIRDAEVPSGLRTYLANMVYVGILAQLLGIPISIIHNIVSQHFLEKQEAIQTNMRVVALAEDWAVQHLKKHDPYKAKQRKSLEKHVITTGNTAAALGSIYGGVQFIGWYPITPATSLVETLIEYLPELRKDPVTGKNTYVIVQAEDEIAAVGMGIGAGWGGLRSMTATSGPGLSLMSEYLGLAYFAEIPVVIWDVQRVGPSTGLPTRTSQGDLSFVNNIGHGDTQLIILMPGNVNECFEFGWKALDLAEHFQTPVVVLSDLDLGMNHWIAEKFKYPDKPLDRGKVLWELGLEKMLRKLDGKWGRYLDVDGDGIPYRTIPGNRHPKAAYFVRGTGHDEFAKYREDPVVWKRMFNRIKLKFEKANTSVPCSIVDQVKNATTAIISWGTTADAITEARQLLALNGKQTDHLRVRAYPFPPDVKEFIAKYNEIYVIELNRDGQLCQLLTIEFPEYATRFKKMAHLDGMPLSATQVIRMLTQLEENLND